MAMTDPIADFLSRIRNANSVSHDKVDVPSSYIKLNIAQVLKQERRKKMFTIINLILLAGFFILCIIYSQ